MVKVFAPILVKLLLIDCFMESMAVKMPTNAVIPMAIISTVNTVRSNWLLIEERDILIFSVNRLAIYVSKLRIKSNYVKA